MKALDWTDAAAVRLWLDTLREAIDDAAVVSEDMLRAPRERSLGPQMHRQMYGAAARSVASLLAFVGPGPDDEHGDPAGFGGSGAE